MARSNLELSWAVKGIPRYPWQVANMEETSTLPDGIILTGESARKVDLLFFVFFATGSADVEKNGGGGGGGGDGGDDRGDGGDDDDVDNRVCCPGGRGKGLLDSFAGTMASPRRRVLSQVHHHLHQHCNV